VNIVCCQVEVPVTGRSFVQRRRTECGVPECDFETSTLSRPWPTGGCQGIKKKCLDNSVTGRSFV